MAITGLGRVPFKSSLIKREYLGKALIYGANNSDISTAMNDFFWGTSTPTSGILKIWDGASWVTKTTKRWSGASWVTALIKRWNGASWVTIA